MRACVAPVLVTTLSPTDDENDYADSSYYANSGDSSSGSSGNFSSGSSGDSDESGAQDWTHLFPECYGADIYEVCFFVLIEFFQPEIKCLFENTPNKMRT